MKIHPSLLGSVVLSVLAALAAPPAGAQVTLTSPPVTSGLTTSSASTLPIAGVVGGQSESVSFSGQAQIRSVLARDPDFGRPTLLLTIYLDGVSGVGSSTNATYVIPSEGLVQRRLAASHEVEITFSFVLSGDTDPTLARSGVASFALGFDVDTGVITSGTGSVASLAF